MKWFGIALVDPEQAQVPTPVGQPCGFCREPIQIGDRGCTIPDFAGFENPFHFECHMRLVIGSLAHQQRRCSCYGGREHDPPGMSLRQAARAAWEYWLAHRGAGGHTRDGPWLN